MGTTPPLTAPGQKGGQGKVAPRMPCAGVLVTTRMTYPQSWVDVPQICDAEGVSITAQAPSTETLTLHGAPPRVTLTSAVNDRSPLAPRNTIRDAPDTVSVKAATEARFVMFPTTSRDTFAHKRAAAAKTTLGETTVDARDCAAITLQSSLAVALRFALRHSILTI